MKQGSIPYQELLDYVSRETIDKLCTYVDLVHQWNRRTSLVQIKTLQEVWNRHILDSLQILPRVTQIIDDSQASKNPLKIIDIGTGAGFPGMVLAISGVKSISLCDSNERKCIFLSEVARTLNVDVEILNCRVSDIPKNHYDLVLSRACSDLSTLLDYVFHVSRETKSRAILHKGKNVNKEISEALKKWSFSYYIYPSILNTDGCILEIFDLRPK
jgi:16S rRNA (guanine527-N7)-methyltransferase